MTTNSFSAGAGFINSVFSTAKIGIGGFYSQHLRTQLRQRINSIGGLKSYSGIKLQFAIGDMWGPAFALRRKMLNEVSQLVK